MSEEIKLDLSLSLNGRFGVDPSLTGGNNGSLVRSASSALDFVGVSRDSHVEGLGRTCSLPLETRKRKEMQMLRRMEVKRKMSVKQSMLCIKSDDEVEEMSIENVIRVGNSGRGFGSMDRIFEDDEHEFCTQTPSPGTRSTETKSPQSVFSFTEKTDYHPKHHSATIKTSGTQPPQKSLPVFTESKQLHMNSSPHETVQDMANMPCVSTKPNGPNGKRVEGFLYGYRKGEEVRIICICHGSSLSPSEFIKHAGGGDVEHPLRHIVVNPAPCSSFSRSGKCMEISKTV